MRSTPPSADVPWPTGPADAALREVAAAVAAARLGFASTLSAWPVLLGRSIFFGLIMLVLGALWDKVAAARLAGTLASSLPHGGLALYVGVTEWITLSVVSVQLRLEDDIRSGALEPHLTRPRSYLSQRIGEALGGMGARMCSLGVTALVLLAVSGRALPPPQSWPQVLVLGVLGACVGTLLYVLVGLTAFWIRRVLPALLIMQKFMFLGGLFAPIALYPEPMHQIAAATPFAAHLAFAGQAILTPSWGDFGVAVLRQLGWIAALGLIVLAVWRAGLARLLREGV